MKLLGRFPLMAFTLVLLSILGICLALQSLGLLLIAGALAAISWYVTEGPRGRYLPRWAANILTVAACLNVFADLLNSQHDVVGVLGRFTVWLTLIKLYERKASRDYGNLLALSLLLMMTACLASADLLFGAVLLIYAALGLYVLLQFQLYSGFESAKFARSRVIPADYRLAPPLRPLFGRAATGHFSVLVLGVASLGFVLSIVVFMSIPRGTGRGFLNRLGGNDDPAAASVTGFVDSVNLQTGTRISDSRRAVMTLQVTDADGEPIPRDRPLLLRGSTLERYLSGGRWLPAERRDPRRVETAAGAFTSVAIEPVDGDPFIELQATMLQPTGTIFAPSGMTDIQTRKERVLEYDFASQTLKVADNRMIPGYRLRVQPEFTAHTAELLTGGMTPPWPPVGGRYRDVVVEALARQILTDASVSLEPPTVHRGEAYWLWTQRVARAFLRWLQNGTYAYTTDLRDVAPLSAARDPIESFLTETRRGHCEYFASAMTALCHTVNVPARIVTGYMAWEYDETNAAYLIRDANAHAWVEVQSGPARWQTYDPSPPDSLATASAPGEEIGDRIRWLYDQLEFNWNSSVVSFDGASQERLLDRFDMQWSDRFRSTFTTFREWANSINRGFYFGWAGYAWLGLVAFIMLLSTAVFVSIVRRRRRIHRVLKLQHVRGAEYRQMLRQLGFYLDMLTVLRRAGHDKPAWQPPRLFARTLDDPAPAAADLVRRITDAFYRVRFGGHTLDRDEAAAVTADLAALERSLGPATSEAA